MEISLRDAIGGLGMAGYLEIGTNHIVEIETDRDQNDVFIEYPAEDVTSEPERFERLPRISHLYKAVEYARIIGINQDDLKRCGVREGERFPVFATWNGEDWYTGRERRTMDRVIDKIYERKMGTPYGIYSLKVTGDIAIRWFTDRGFTVVNDLKVWFERCLFADRYIPGPFPNAVYDN